MKVLYGHCLPDPNHPAARMVHAIAAELRSMGDDVFVHEPEVASKKIEPQSSPVLSGTPKRFQWLRNWLWFARTIAHDRRAKAADIDAIRKFGPDVVIARHDAYRGSLIRAARSCGMPVIVYADAPVAHETRHWSDESSAAGKRFHPPRLVEWYERHHLTLSKGIVAVSEPGKRCLEAYGLKVPVTVIRNGVDRSFLGPVLSAERKRELRKEMGVDTPFLAGFVGTFKPFHGTDLLGSLVRATAGWPDLHWIFVGDGPRKPDLMKSLGPAAEKVTDLGRQPPERLPDLYRLMDFAVAPYPKSSHEFHFCPLKILEAQASGAVVLASDRGDIRALVGDGKYGIIVPGESAEDWANTLRFWMDHPSQLESIALEAHVIAKNQRAWSNAARDLRIMLNRAITNETGGKRHRSQ
jgi:glycosyltransferase involved in cell wall biosynthesis